VVLLSRQPVSRHVNVAPLGINCFPCTIALRRETRPFFWCPAVASQAKRGQERVLEELKNSSQKCLTNPKEYAILQSLKRTPVESLNKRTASKRKCYGIYQVCTLTTQEWKAEQQLARTSIHTTRGVSSSCQFCERAKQHKMLWPGSQLTSCIRTRSPRERWSL